MISLFEGLLINPIFNLNSPSQCKLTYSQILGIKVGTSFERATFLPTAPYLFPSFPHLESQLIFSLGMFYLKLFHVNHKEKLTQLLARLLLPLENLTYNTGTGFAS